jgi:hypothetical protein
VARSRAPGDDRASSRRACHAALGWPWLICNPTRYAEAVVTPGPPLAAVDAVRVGEAYLERLADLTLAGSETSLESATEQRELNAIETVRRWRADHGIAIEAVG